MPEESSPVRVSMMFPPIALLRQVSGLGPVLIGIAVLLGWWLNVHFLKVALPGFTTMKANTAAGLLAAGLGVLLVPGRASQDVARWRLPLAASAGAAAVLVGALTLAEYVLGMPLGLDEVLFADPHTTSPPYPGRMSPETAAGLACSGVAVVLLARAVSLGQDGGAQGRARGVAIAHALALVPTLIGYLSLAGYAYAVEGLYSFGAFVTVALHTAIGMGLLASAILLTLPDLGWGRAFKGRPVARGVFARLLPAALLLPFLAGLAVIWGARARAYDPLYGPALFAVIAAAASVGLTWTAVMAVRWAEGDLLDRTARLIESEARFRTLADTIPALMFITDAKGENTYTNTIFQHLTGFTARALLGDGWLDAIHADDRERARSAWDEAWQTGQVYETEYRFRCRDGDYRWHLVRGTPLRDGEGRITQWVGVGVDVQDVVDARNALAQVNSQLESRVAERTAELAATLERLRAEIDERAAAEAQVRQLQKIEAIGQLTSGIAHDFNNMLAVVVGSLDLAKRRLADDRERALSLIENAEEGARRAGQLTARLLAFSRQAPLDPQVIDANKVVGGMMQLLCRTMGEGLRVDTALAASWLSRADPGQLENAILNLCVNARDAMPDSGILTIETANASLDDLYARAHAGVDAGQYVMVAVTDTGAGMTPEVAERAFDPFFTTKGVGKGTGLGLSQVYSFAKQSGGHVRIYSRPGAGTTVRLYLPRYLGAVDTSGEASDAPGDLPRARAGEVILLVEDEATVRRMLSDALGELGYDVVQAHDADEAFAALDAEPRIDLLFTDVVMPDMNGRALAAEVRRRRSGIRTLFTTGYTRSAVLQRGLLNPDVIVLAKPFTVEQLARTVRSVLDERLTSASSR